MKSLLALFVDEIDGRMSLNVQLFIHFFERWDRSDKRLDSEFCALTSHAKDEWERVFEKLFLHSNALVRPFLKFG